MPKIVVSYRRSDSAATAGRIYDHLGQHFGPGSVFMDVDAIPFGTDFRTHIKSELLHSDVLLAVIGPRWTGPAEGGPNRIDDEADPVRVEVETALRNGITIVPVLIDGTRMPSAGELPEALKSLAFVNAAPVDMGRDFRAHMERLTRSLETILAAKAAGSEPPPASAPAAPRGNRMAGLALAGVLLSAGVAAAGWFGWSTWGAGQAAPRAGTDVAKIRAPSETPGGPRPAVEAPVLRIETQAPSVAAPAVPGPPAAPAVPGPPAAPAVPGPPAAAAPPPAAAPQVGTTPAVASARRSRAHGTFAWYELWTTNAAAAQSFYRSVVGWDARTSGTGDAAYTLLLAGPLPVAGLATLPAATVAQGVRPAWVGYVTVTDVDASTDEARRLGGTVYRAPADVPNIGRYALVADPQGAPIVLFKGLVEAAPTSGGPAPVGHAGWRALQTGDRDVAFAFYATLFGWTRTEAGDVAQPGQQFFAAGPDVVGAVAEKPAGLPAPGWTYAFQVDGVSAAAARAQASGGTILGPPQPARGGQWIVEGLDPQGARFALISRAR